MAQTGYGGGGSSGAPGGPVAPAGAGGASKPCFGGCGFVAKVPVVFPAYALVKGNRLTMEIACKTVCRGVGALRYSRKGTVIAQFRFQLGAKGLARVTAKLNAAGRKLLAKKKRVIASVSIDVIAARGAPTTYVSALELTRMTPRPHGKGKHKRSKRAGVPVLRVVG